MLHYDTYLSYHNINQQWTEGYLIPQLLAADYHIATSARVVSLNEPYWTSNARAIQQSRCVVLVVSAAWLGQEWGHIQRYVQGDSGREPQVIALLLEPITLPPNLAALPILDCTNAQQWKGALVQLLTLLGAPLAQIPPTPVPPTLLPSSPSMTKTRTTKTNTMRLLWDKFTRKES